LQDRGDILLGEPKLQCLPNTQHTVGKYKDISKKGKKRGELPKKWKKCDTKWVKGRNKRPWGAKWVRCHF